MAASPPHRVAVLIGQQNYAGGSGFGEAPYTHNDVAAMDELLRVKCGFQVFIFKDVDRSFFKHLPGLLAQSLHGRSEAILILFYAGHGLSFLGEHFVIPIDARAEDPATWINVKDLIRPVHDVAGGAQALRDQIAAEHSTRPAPKSLVLVALDCCLQKPKPAARRAVARMVTAEFAAKAVVAEGEAEETTLEGDKPKPWTTAVTAATRVQPIATEVCIMYACSEGRPAMPCKDAELGHFTHALKRAVEMWPGEDLATISKECRRLCLEASKGQQCPWTADSTSTKWILRPVVHTWGPAAVPQLVEFLCGECSEADRQQAARELRKLAADAVAKAGSAAGLLGLASSSSEAEEVAAAAKTLRFFAGYAGQLVHLLHEGSSELQVNVASVLAELAQHGPTGESLRNVGSIPALMRMVQSNEVEVQWQATAALKALAINVESSGQGSQISTFQAEALLCFFQMLEQGQATASEHDALALGNALAASESNRRWITRMGRWPDLVRMLEVRTSGTCITMTSMLMEGVLADDSLRPIVQAGAVPYFVKMLGSEHREMREKAIKVLEIVAEKDDNRNLIEQAGPQLVAILQVEDVDSTSAQEAAACVLTSLALGSDENRELILQAGVIPPLVQVLGARGTVAEKATTALQLLALRDANRVPIVQAGACPALVRLLESGSSGQQEEAVDTIRRLAEEPANVELIAQCGALPQLVRLLEIGTAVAREQAAFALGVLANSQGHRVRITQLRPVPSLIRLLETGSDGAKEAAGYALARLAYRAPENQRLIEQEGACLPLVELLKTGTERCRQTAAAALSSLADDNRRNSQLIARLGAGPYLLHLLESDIAEAKEAAARAFACLGCEEPVCLEETVQLGACQALVDLLESGVDRVRQLAACALHRFAEGRQEVQAQIVQLGAVPHLMQMLESEECALAAAKLFKQLARGEPRNKELMAQAGACRALAERLRSGRSDAQRTAADALGTLASATIGNNQLIAQLVVPDLVRMLESGTDHSAAYAVWALTEWEPGRQEIIAQAGACTALVRVLATGTQHARPMAALALAKIAGSSKSMSKAIVQLGAVDHLLRLVDSESDVTKWVVPQALWYLAGEPQNKKCIVQAGACPALVRLSSYSSPNEAQFYAVCALCRLAGNNRRTWELIVELGALPAWIELLQSEDNDTKEVAACTLAYLVKTSTKVQSLLPDLGAVPPLVQLVESGSGGARIGAACTLGQLAVGHSKNRELIEQAGARPALLSLQEAGSAEDQKVAKDVLSALSCSRARWWLFNTTLGGLVLYAASSIPLICAIKLRQKCLTRPDR